MIKAHRRSSGRRGRPRTLGVGLVAVSAVAVLGVAVLPACTSKNTATADGSTVSCTQLWPPLLVSAGQALVGERGAITSRLGTITRRSGATQVTYGGHPLYLFGRDTPGATSGEGVSGFGGTFDVVSSTGAIVVTSPAAS